VRRVRGVWRYWVWSDDVFVVVVVVEVVVKWWVRESAPRCAAGRVNAQTTEEVDERVAANSAMDAMLGEAC